MGGKGSISQPPSVDTGLPSGSGTSDELMQQMIQLMQAQVAMASAAPPEIPAIPTVYESPTIDWTDKIGQLNQKMKADYATENARKKGVLDTISPESLLADTTAPDTTHKSLLSKS